MEGPGGGHAALVLGVMGNRDGRLGTLEGSQSSWGLYLPPGPLPMEAIDKMASLCMRDPDEGEDEGTDEEDVEADDDLLVSTRGKAGGLPRCHCAIQRALMLGPRPCAPAGRAERGPWGGTEDCGVPPSCGSGIAQQPAPHSPELEAFPGLSAMLPWAGDMTPLRPEGDDDFLLAGGWGGTAGNMPGVWEALGKGALGENSGGVPPRPCPGPSCSRRPQPPAQGWRPPCRRGWPSTRQRSKALGKLEMVPRCGATTGGLR